MNEYIFNTIFKINMQVKTIMEKELKVYEINFNAFNVLNNILNNKDNNVTSICRNLIIKNSSMTYVINKLEDRSLLTKTAIKTDMRNFNLKLTKKGVELAKELNVKYNAILKILVKDVNNLELDKHLSKLSNNIDKFMV